VYKSKEEGGCTLCVKCDLPSQRISCLGRDGISKA
jgi:hypothetical protein